MHLTILKSLYHLAWENSLYFVTPPLVSHEMTSEKQCTEIPYWRRTTDLGSASDWMKQPSHTAQQIKEALPRSG